MMQEQREDRILACVKNAEDLIKAARITLSEDLPSIAYHLGLLAIEELGKACLLFSFKPANLQERWVQKRIEDHEEKIFYAFFFGHVSTGKIDRQKLEEAKNFAKRVHIKRQESLYVSFKGEPVLRIPNEEALNIVKLAEAQLGITKDLPNISFSTEFLSCLYWLHAMLADEEKKKRVFSPESIDMLTNLKDDVEAWIKWLQHDFENQEKLLQELLQQELRREKPGEVEAQVPKWQFKVRLQAISHSTKQKDLEWWNKQSNWLKLYATEKKGNKEVIISFSLPQAVHIRNVWDIGYWPTKLFVLALNIGSQGFFWWYSLNSQDTFYEQILDLDNEQPMKTKPNNPALNMDWGNKSLEQKDLEKIGICLYFLPKLEASQEEQQPFVDYLRGLGFLAKTDIHLNLTPNACDLFFRSLKSGMKFYGDWESINMPFSKAFKNYFKEAIPQDEYLEELIKLNDRFEKGEKEDFADLTFDMVMQVKVLCDVYFMRTFYRLAEKESKNWNL